MKELTNLEKYPNLLELRWLPDGEDIGFKINSAFKVFKRMKLFNYIRNHILANSAEGFL
jgi:hypothetical protein